MRITLHPLLTAGALLACVATASAQTRPAVVELFTSEGCSSCPPAEAYVGELAKRADVLPLTLHVDYWDGLGWHDRFGLPKAVQRQRAYAVAFRLSSVYTPQVVIDGREDFVGSDRASIGRALTFHRHGVAVALSVRDGEILVDVGAQAIRAASDVVLLAYRRTAVSPIDRGENAGHTINEYNIVRDFRSLGRWNGLRRQYHARLDSLPRDATDAAVLIQPLPQGPIIGAASVALR